MIELLLVIGILATITAVTATTIFRRKNTEELDRTTRQIVSLLREAQTRSVAQASSTTWGVRLENATSNPFYSLFLTSTYSTDTRVGFYPLPVVVRYATATLPVGSSTTVTFTQLTGLPSVSSTLVLELLNNDLVSASSSIIIDGSGLITY